MASDFVPLIFCNFVGEGNWRNSLALTGYRNIKEK